MFLFNFLSLLIINYRIRKENVAINDNIHMLAFLSIFNLYLIEKVVPY